MKGKMARGIHIGVVLLMALALILCVGCGAVESGESLEGFTAYLDGRIPRLMERYDIPGVSIALIQGGEIAWATAYGYADLERGREMTVDTICRTESISKTVTAWGVMRLIEEGKIKLDAPVGSYIQNWEFPEAGLAEEITVRQLLSHSSGLALGTIGGEYPPGGEMPSLEENLYREVQQVQEPGTFMYSNVGYNLLELLVEEVTGRDFCEYMETEVLGPLGMEDASFAWREDMALPTGYDLKSRPVPPYVYPESASGGLLATVEDVARFGIADMGFGMQSVLSWSSIALLQTPAVNVTGQYALVSGGYGFGHFIETLPDGSTAVFHGGQGHGWMTHLHLVPDRGEGIVILTNSQRSWPFISYVLSDWARWNGYPSVGMGIISVAVNWIWALMGLIAAACLWRIGRIIHGLIGYKRRIAPLSRHSRIPRLVRGILALGIAALVAWCASLDYMFLSAVFPAAYPWMGAVLCLLAASLLLSALCPQILEQEGLEPPEV